MRKILFSFALSILVMGCTKDISVTDYRFTPEISVSSGEVFENRETGIPEVYKNTPLLLSLNIEGNNSENIEHSIRYILKPGEAVIKKGEQTLSPNTPISHKFKDGALNIGFTPNSSGLCELHLTVENEHISKTVPFKLFVREPSYMVTFNGLPDNKYLEKKFAFTMKIDEVVQSESTTRTVQAYGKVTKGTGDIFISDQIIAENDKPNLVKIGSNIISYNAKELDENVLTFEIEDKYGTLQRFPVSFIIEKPEFRLDLIKDYGTPKVNTDYSFKVKIDKQEHPTNKFAISYRFIKGSGSLKLNGKKTEPGSKSDALAGDNIFILNTAAVGDVEIEIIVTDKYDTQSQIVFSSTAEKNDLDAVFESSDVPFVMGDSRSFTANVSESNYAGKYYCTYRFAEGSGEIQANGSAKSEGSRFELTAGTNNFRFIPSQPGSHQIEFSITDEAGQEVNKSLVFEVTSNKITVSCDDKPVVQAGSPALFNIKALEDNYNSTFTAQYSLISGAGVLKNGTAVIAPNGTITLNNNTPLSLTFTPEKIGQNILKFTVKDIYNTVEIINIDVTATSPDFTITHSTPPSVVVGNSSKFNITLNEPFYENNKFTVTHQITRGSGDLNHNGISVEPGVEFDLIQGSNGVTFTPTTIGLNTLKLIVTDCYSTSKEYFITVIATADNMTVTKLEDPVSAIINKPAHFSFDVGHPYYNDDITVKFELTRGSGVLKFGNATYSTGQTFQTKTGMVVCSFIPATVADHAFKITVTDNENKSKSLTYSVQGLANILNFSQPSNITKGTAYVEQTVSVSFSESNYAGNYKVTFQMESGSGELSYNGKSITNSAPVVFTTSGVKSLQYTPLSLGSSSFKITIMDDYGQSVTKTINVNNITSYEITLTPVLSIDGLEKSYKFDGLYGTTLDPYYLNVTFHCNKKIPIDIALSGKARFSVAYYSTSSPTVSLGEYFAPISQETVETNVNLNFPKNSLNADGRLCEKSPKFASGRKNSTLSPPSFRIRYSGYRYAFTDKHTMPSLVWIFPETSFANGTVKLIIDDWKGAYFPGESPSGGNPPPKGGR